MKLNARCNLFSRSCIYDNITEEILNTLIEQCKKGNRNDQYRFFQLYADHVFRVCLRYMGNKPEAEDCVSRTFLNVFNNMIYVSFENEKMLLAWMRKIAVNECLMSLRKKVKNMDVFVEGEPIIDDKQDFLSNIEASYLLEIIQSLPVGYRTVFNLYAIEGYTHEEIGQQLGIAIGTSKSQLNRARSLLQEKLKKMEEK